MRVFVTGATGFVGSAVVAELLGVGHRVLGLSRSDAGAAALAAAGAEVHRGDLADPDGLRRAAQACDGVIHTAFDHDFFGRGVAALVASCEADRRVVAALGDALVGSDRPLVVTSAIGVLPQGRLLTEDTRPATGASAHPRAASEDAADAVAGRGVRVSVVRLPPSVHDAGDHVHGFVPTLIRIARERRVSAFVGTGENRWPAVHRPDVARLYRLALETRTTGGRWHAAADEGVPFRDIAALIGLRLGVPVVGMDPDEAARHFGPFAHFAAMDVPTSSRLTRERLGWQPTGPSLLADLDSPAYLGR